MIKNGSATTGLLGFHKYPKLDESAVVMNRPSLKKQLPEPEPKGQVTIQKNQPTKSQKPNDEDLEAKDKGPVRLEAKILNYQSPSLMYVSLVHQQEVFTKLFEDGNEELVAFENLRKRIVLHKIPTQAHKCILNRIRPVNDRWEAKFLDYLHKTIVEKYCYAKIIGPPIDGLIPIEIKYVNLCINDHLVNLDMALYTDGSKALVLKYAPTVNETQKLEQSIESHSSSDCNVQYDEVTTSPTTAYTTNISTTYLPFTKSKFKCDIDGLNEVENLQLVIVHDNETREAYRYC